MSEANNFQDREVIAKLSAIEAKLDKDSDSEFRNYVKRELNSIKALVTQPSKVCNRNYFLFYFSKIAFVSFIWLGINIKM